MTPRARPALARVSPSPTALGVLALLTAGCAVHTPVENPDPPVRMPEGYGETPDADGPLPERWWRTLDAPQLSQLIDRMLVHNFELRSAWARIEQADALIAEAGSAFWPQIEGRVNASRNRFVTPVVGAVTNDAFSASVAASYELDVWGRLSSLEKAAVLDRAALRHDLEGLAMTLTAQVAERYFDVVAAEARIALLDDQLKTNELFLELVMLRFAEGQVSALDVHQQRQLVAQTRSDLALLQAARTVAANQLAVLLGLPPGELHLDDAPDTLPSPPPLPATGVPAQLLERRPDLAAARRRIEAADSRVAAAVAARFPALRLTGQASLEANEFATQVLSPLWSLTAALTAPLFDAGRLRAQVAQQRAVVVERVQAFGQAALTALVEVHNALVEERQQRENLEHLQAQAESAAGGLRESRYRYQQGLSDFLPVLTALRTQQQVERALIDARRQLLSRRIQLYRALGGTWTESLHDPLGEEPVSQAAPPRPDPRARRVRHSG